MMTTLKSDRHESDASIWTLEIWNEDLVGQPRPSGKFVTYIATPSGSDWMVIDGEIHDALVLTEHGDPLALAVGEALSDVI